LFTDCSQAVQVAPNFVKIGITKNCEVSAPKAITLALRITMSDVKQTPSGKFVIVALGDGKDIIAWAANGGKCKLNEWCV